MMRLLMALVLSIPLGLDLYMPVPETNPLTVQQIRLGRRLFNDKRLSRDQSLACVSCHDPNRAFSTARPLSIGVFGRQGRRNVPALINRGYGRAFFWDGRITSLEEQVLRPYVNGNRKALTPDQQAGLQVFRGKGNCTACHVGPTFSDERFHNTGVAWVPSAGSGQGGYQDDGRFIVSGKPEQRGAFKTPTLREVARTSPYMHDGSLATLEDVVKFYDQGGPGRTRPTFATAESRRPEAGTSGTLNCSPRHRWPP